MFDKDDYIKVIDLLTEHGWTASLDWHSQQAVNNVLIRHDIDFSIEYAYEVAQLERELGITSTYFFMISSNMYNLFSQKNINLVHKIRDLNHKVSLHYDPTVYTSDNFFAWEKASFEEIFNVEIDIVSIHRPRDFLIENNKLINGIAHTYMDKYFKDMVYISDSGGKEIYQKIQEYVKLPPKKPLQLLTHPIWWQGKSTSPTETLNAWKIENCKFLVDELKANCGSYKGCNACKK